MYETQKETYHATERVSLVSSFMASLLVGNYASIDHSDGAGMNLMDLHSRTWSPDALDVSPPLLIYLFCVYYKPDRVLLSRIFKS